MLVISMKLVILRNLNTAYKDNDQISPCGRNDKKKYPRFISYLRISAFRTFVVTYQPSKEYSYSETEIEISS